ncbi:MAG: O-antigen ligase family protein, partial [Actinomycetota bacterium]
VPVAQAGAPARRRKLALPAGWPIYALFAGFPLWWGLGLGSFIWPILAMPMLLGLLRQKDVRMPRGFGLWLLFIGWLIISVTQLESAGRLAAYLYRGSAYFSITVLFLYVYNAPRDRVPTKKIVVALTLFWMFVVAGGYLGTFYPNGGISTIAAKIVPAGVGDESLKFILNPPFANRGEASRILGYEIGRPAAPFAYTNAWGANFALLVPFAIMSLSFVKKKSWKLLVLGAMGASIVPVVSSLNRGLWLSLTLGLLYAAGLFALKGRPKAFVRVAAVLGVAAVAVLTVGPINRVFFDRLDRGHSDEGRKGLYSEALEITAQKPILGYGAPVESAADPTKPSVGTHGQFWLVLVSTGFVGAGIFVGWYCVTLWRTRKGKGAFDMGTWCHVVVAISLVQIFFYEQLPTQLNIVMVAAALGLRELRPASRAEVEAEAAQFRGDRRVAVVR